MRVALFCLSIICSIPSPLPAQDNDNNNDKPRKAGGRVAYFIYTSLPEGVENPMTVMTGKDVVRLTLSKRAVSEAVKIPADGVVRVVRRVENPQDPAKPAYLTLAEAKIAGSVNKALVILTPTGQARNERLFHTKVQDLATFRGGDYLFLNLTNLKVGVEMGAAKLALGAGETKIYNAPKAAESTNVPVRYSFYHPKDQQWKMLSASTVVLHATRREICIFSWDPRFGRIDYHGITFPVAKDNTL